MTAGLAFVDALLREVDPAILRATLIGLRDAVLCARPEPDVLIGGEDVYMRRWWLVPRNKHGLNVYLHHFLRSDDDRALHDHPWANPSVLIEGRYLEHRPKFEQAPAGETVRFLREAGDIVYRESGEISHRVELLPVQRSSRMAKYIGDRWPPPLQTVWTLFLTGPKTREWGFHCPQGWKSWQAFTGQDDRSGPVRDYRVMPGGGCGEAT